MNSILWDVPGWAASKNLSNVVKFSIVHLSCSYIILHTTKMCEELTSSARGLAHSCLGHLVCPLQVKKNLIIKFGNKQIVQIYTLSTDFCQLALSKILTTSVNNIWRFFLLSSCLFSQYKKMLMVVNFLPYFPSFGGVFPLFAA